MAKNRFNSLDLNLLKTLLVLSQELNMRKASTRLNVSQPAISQALQKLRHHFDDELFVKVRSGLEPTRFTLDLVQRISPYMDGLAQAVNGIDEFDPRAVNQSVTIIVATIAELSLAGRLYERVKELAPNLRLEFASWGEDALQQIIKGKSCIAIGNENKNYKEVYGQKLLDIEGVLIARKDHSLIGERIDIEQLAQAEIASFVIPGWNDNRVIVADVLAQHNIDVQVKVRSTLIYPIINIVRRSDAITAHSNIFPFADFPDLAPIKMKVDKVYSGGSIYAHYHVKDRENPLVNWLVDLISKELKQQVSDNQCLLS
ncbi:LysR family transcriptional regulator [Vibrio rarus]|uniref:LysR family transcriptional regulator n=1 Tax=Vibrio rarus TaxID=413403 RepID=UPI0021C29E1D|nr:LysR family transcriptional regulator [Vibrio rarus]